MALIGNYAVLAKSLGRNLGGPSLAGDRANWGRPGASNNRFFGSEGGGLARSDAVPRGYRPPYAWQLSTFPGGAQATQPVGLSSVNQVGGSGVASNVNLAGGMSLANDQASTAGSGVIFNADAKVPGNLSTTILGVGDITPPVIIGLYPINSTLAGAGATSFTITAVGNASASIVGTGVVGNSNLAGALNAVASLSGTGSVSDAAASMLIGILSSLSGTSSISAPLVGAIQILATIAASGSLSPGISGAAGIASTLAGQGVVSPPLLQSVADMVAAVHGSGAVTSAFADVIGQLASSIEGVGLFVSNPIIVPTLAAVATINGLGTVALTVSAPGHLNITLNGQSVFSNTIFATGNISAQVSTFTALSPQTLAAALLDNEDVESNLSVREALRLLTAVLGGKVSGGGTATITIRDVNDSKDRIVATVTNDGNRTSVVYDLD